MSIASRLTDVPHPGEFIREELEARGWSQRDLAYILGVPEQAVNMIVSGKRGISPEMALALGNAFGVSADYFANLQKSYEMANARKPDPSIARRAQLQSVYPVREMIRRGWIADTDVGLLEAQMTRFFGKNSLEDIPYLAYAAKKSDYSETTPTQLAWLFRVRQIVAEMVVPSYAEKKLRALLNEMPRYMIDPDEIRHVSRALAECGVRFTIVETLPKANIDGVCFWLDASSPAIGMTTRYDRIDNFWFVLRHEIEHVLRKDGQGDTPGTERVDVELEGERAGTGNELPPEERAANAAAASFCVPSEELESFYVRKFPFISERDMLGFAGRVQRHPGIVVGQLQRKMDRYDWLARYKVKVRQHLIGNAVVDGWGVAAPVSF
jgi:HTH-type transcriptional regulator/antitoxin HigA